MAGHQARQGGLTSPARGNTCPPSRAPQQWHGVCVQPGLQCSEPCPEWAWGNVANKPDTTGRVRAYMGMGRAAALPATFRGKKTPPRAQLLRAQGCPDLQFQWGLHVAWRSPACTLPFCGLTCMKGLGAAVSRWGRGAHLPAEGHDVLPESLGLTLICLPPLLHMHTFSAL